MPTTSGLSELRRRVKVEVDVLRSPSLIIGPYGLSGHQATFNSSSELRNCVRVEVGVLGLTAPNSLYSVSVDVKNDIEEDERSVCVHVHRLRTRGVSGEGGSRCSLE